MTELRLVLRLNDRSSYSLAGLNPRNLPDQVPSGRAFRADSGREIQIAVLAAGATGPEQLAAVKELAERRRTDTSAAQSEGAPRTNRPVTVPGIAVGPSVSSPIGHVLPILRDRRRGGQPFGAGCHRSLL